MAQIQPITFPILGTANTLLLRVLPFEMDATTASFYYELNEVTEDNGTFSTKNVINGNLTMDETDFQNWGADNNYCLEWAAQKLGIVLL